MVKLGSFELALLDYDPLKKLVFVMVHFQTGGFSISGGFFW